MFDKKAYDKEYYAKNKDKKKAASAKRHIEKREEILPQMREYGAKWRKMPHTKSLQDQERARLRQEVLEHYGGKCACCGESENEFLAIDHINGGGNKQRKELKRAAGIAFYRWLRMNEYPDGYRVLCHNCNCARGYYGYCPHEKR